MNELLTITEQGRGISPVEFTRFRQELASAKRRCFALETPKVEPLQLLPRLSELELSQLSRGLNLVVSSGGRIAVFSVNDSQFTEMLIGNNTFLVHKIPSDPQKSTAEKITDPTFLVQLDRSPFRNYDLRFSISRRNNNRIQNLYSEDLSSQSNDPGGITVLVKDKNSPLWKTALTIVNHKTRVRTEFARKKTSF